MTYAFHTPDKLCFILDLMHGGDLHYHLAQHGVFNELDMKFYAAEVILGNHIINLCIIFKLKIKKMFAFIIIAMETRKINK